MPAGSERKNFYKSCTVDVLVVISISFACTCHVRFLVAFVKSKNI